MPFSAGRNLLRYAGACLLALAYLAPGSAFASQKTCQPSLLPEASGAELEAPLPPAIASRAYFDRPEVGAQGLWDNPFAFKLWRFAELGQLLDQQDKRLGPLGFLLDKGGICTAACLVNILMPMLGEPVPHEPQDAPGLLGALLTAYSRYHGAEHDPRLGAEVTDFLTAARRILEPLAAEFGPSYAATETALSAEERLAGVTVATARVSDAYGRPLSMEDPFHAILVLKIDKARRLVTVSDPNRANLIYARPYTLNVEGKPTFESLVRFGPQPAPHHFTLEFYQRVRHDAYPREL